MIASTAAAAAAAAAYTPVATSPTDADVADTAAFTRSPRSRPSQKSKLHRRFLLPLTTRPKLVLSVLISLSLLALLHSLRLYAAPSFFGHVDDPYAAPPAENPWFHTGDVWAHNDAVAARIDRCAALGLLRNTSDPLPANERLSDEEEAELMAEGCGTNQTTIVILSSLYIAEAYAGTYTAGETVYAQSLISALNAYNYSYVFSSLGWYNADMRKTVELWHRHRGNVRAVLADPEQVKICWEDERQKCLKTEENMDGIEAWRILGFWYWDDPGNPLGPAFTLSPSPRNPNHFLSYSIEPTCRRLPYLPPALRSSPPQAYLLAKQMNYLDDTPKFSWTLPALVGLQDELGIQVVAGMKNDDEETAKRVEEIGLRNLGPLGKLEFYAQLAKSFVFIGVGRPRISPSPWDALCMGVPFINPILTWDEADPTNRSSWHAQQWHMTDLSPPYVYSVPAHNLTALTEAVREALDNPIESYIPDYMKFDFVCERMAEVVEGPWRAKGQEVLEERKASGGKLFVM
ncbi:hypothetical protein IAT38_006996 [Cryptococcus sp. DSM 104549]